MTGELLRILILVLVFAAVLLLVEVVLGGEQGTRGGVADARGLEQPEPGVELVVVEHARIRRRFRAG